MPNLKQPLIEEDLEKRISLLSGWKMLGTSLALLACLNLAYGCSGDSSEPSSRRQRTESGSKKSYDLSTPDQNSRTLEIKSQQKGDKDVVYLFLEQTYGESVSYDGHNQQFREGNIETAFSIEGWNDGKYFTNFIDRDGKKVHIAPSFNPNDDVMGVFIVGFFSKGEPYIDIYLDKQWKEKLGKVNIWYGKDFENYEEFDFENQISPGLYWMRIKDDVSRFMMGSDPLQSQGGLLLGDLHRDDWLNQTPEGKVVIKFD